MDGKDRFLMCFFLFMCLYGGFEFFLNEVIYAFTYVLSARKGESCIHFLKLSGPGRRNNENMSETAPPWSDRFDDGDGGGYYDDYSQGPPPPREPK